MRMPLRSHCTPPLVLLLAGVLVGLGPLEEDQEPICYSTAPVNDPVAKLAKRMQQAQSSLAWDDAHGYLPAVLKELGIDTSSQTLVFSKTSFQRELISPKTPRALYFNDSVYIGWVKGGSVLEVASQDCQQGTIFYTLDQRKQVRPNFVRQTHECLQCHSGSMTSNVPGLMVRSLITDRAGQPIHSAGSHLTDHTSPLTERWGGWYVTGHSGQQRHMGNITANSAAEADNLDLSAGVNLLDLTRKFDTGAYLSPHSDIVALLVLEHQGQGHNLLTKANWQTRLALRDEKAMNEALGQPADTRSPSTAGRIKSACEPLVRYLFFAGEARLTSPIEGTSGFTKDFTSRGPKDANGRSLRDLDLQTRLLKYPLSWLIYTAEFDHLPELAHEYVARRLGEVLLGKDRDPRFAHLTPEIRSAIIEIVRQTKPGLAKGWE